MSLEFSQSITPFHLNVVKTDFTSHQVIYASQLYGTFFAIAARLNKDSTGNKLASMDLTLVNYKGLYNIGMLDETRTSFDSNGNTPKLTVHLSAFAGTHGNGKSIPVDCNHIPLSTLTKMEVNRQLHSFYSGGSPISKHLEDNCFDSEFYERDGSAIRAKTRMDDLLDAHFLTSYKPDSSSSGVCKNASINFV
jgi:hypothetical protein